MFKNSLKLARKLLVLTILLGALGYVSGLHPVSAATGSKCCSQCEPEFPCLILCEEHPNMGGCAFCFEQYENCLELCNPDPNC